MKRYHPQRIGAFRKRLIANDDMDGFVSTVSGFLPPLSFPHRAGERSGIFTTIRTFWLFLYQIIAGNLSLDRTVEKAIGWIQPQVGKLISPNTGGYSQARSRFPLDWLIQVLKAMTQAVSPVPDFHGYLVKVVDGSGILMEDTPENRDAFPPHPSTGKSRGFPALKLLPIFSLANGRVLDWRIGRITESDSALFRELWPHLHSGDLVLGDRHFCSYASFAILLSRGVHSVARLHQRRIHVRVIKVLGDGDRVVEWEKPKVKPPWVSDKEWEKIPETLRIRETTYQVAPPGFRTKKICIATTVLDEKIPAKDWAELFRKRWTAELNLRHIKTTMELEFLRAKSPEMVKKEVGFFLLGYNIVRIIMEKASEAQGVPLEKLSFKSAVSAINIWSPKLAGAQTKAEYEYWWNELLRVVGYPRLRNRKDRTEPRAKKLRPKGYQLLMGDRHEFKEIQHRKQYKKPA